MLRIKVSKTYPELSRIFFLSTLLLLLPFAITDLAYIGSDDSTCLYYKGQNDSVLFPYFYLGDWLMDDGYIKLAIVVISMILVRTRRQSHIIDSQIVVVTLANIIGLFWFFNLGWTIAGAILFWGDIVGASENGSCILTNSLNGYMYAVLIINFIQLPLGIAISMMRPSYQQETHIVLDENSNVGNNTPNIMT